MTNRSHERLINLLNEVLVSQNRALMQSIQQISVASHRGERRFARTLTRIVRAELSDALRLAGEVVALGGLPDTDVPEFVANCEPARALQDNVELREAQLELLETVANHLSDLGDPPKSTGRIVERITRAKHKAIKKLGGISVRGEAGEPTPNRDGW